MKLLALDTATEACSVALSLDGTIMEQFELCPQQHSQRLLPMVDDLLQQAGVALKDMDALVFGRGPGSFTGVRIAIGMLQGLALGADKPVIGISTLATMAQEAIQTLAVNQVMVAIDARMGEVYFGHYRNDQGKAVLVGSEQVLPPNAVLDYLASADKPEAVAVGTGWEAFDALKAIPGLDYANPIRLPRARYMLPLAEDACNRGQAVSVDEATPVYLRDKVTWKKLPGRE